MASAVSATETRVSTSVELPEELSGSGFGPGHLGGVLDTPMDNGDLAFVNSLDGYFSLNKEDTSIVDDITILYTETARMTDPPGPGRWLRNNIDPPLTQANWFINALTGKDNKSGDTAAKALKTFAEFQRRIGTFTVLNPIGGVLTVTILTDLPDTDPITFKNFFAPGTSGIIVGTEKVLKTGVVAAATNKNRLTNTPWQIQAPGIAWGTRIAKAIVMTSGGAAGIQGYVARDLGADTGHISEWAIDAAALFGPPNLNGFMFPSSAFLPTPAPGDAFKIVDYSTVSFGSMIVGGDPSKSASPFLGLVGGLLLKNLHVRFVPPGGVPSSFPQAIGSMETICALQNVIVDNLIESPGPDHNSDAWNCCFTNQVTVLPGGSLAETLGLHVSIDPTIFLTIEDGAKWIDDGDTTFVGQGAPFLVSGLNILQHGAAFTGPLSFWDNSSPLNAPQKPWTVGPQAEWFFPKFSPFFGETEYVPLWGTGNDNRIDMAESSMLVIESTSFSGVEAPLPTIVMAALPILFRRGGQVPTSAFSWDDAPPSYTGPVAFTWAGLLVAQPAGFLIESYGATPNAHRVSSAQDPASKTLVYRDSSF